LTSGGTGRAAILLLRATVVIVGDLIPERLAQARSFGCETIDLRERIPLGEGVGQILGVPEVDSAVDCIGFEAKGQAEQAGTQQPATLNSLMALTRAGGAIGIPGLYVTDDPGAEDSSARKGVLGLRIGLGWAKSHSFGTGQCPVLSDQPTLVEVIEKSPDVGTRSMAPLTLHTHIVKACLGGPQVYTRGCAGPVRLSPVQRFRIRRWLVFGPRPSVTSNCSHTPAN
jgi:threonine dehydrogenase-like Zn-dependent dehydrogenase